MSGINFKKITLSEWKQFQEIDIDFHPRLTILTGANGSGKTTILNLLARHFGWTILELATPAKDEKTGAFRYFPFWFKSLFNRNNNVIGEILYTNNVRAPLTILLNQQNPNQAQYNINIVGMQQIKGINIPSHRPVFYYSQVNSVATQRRTKQEAYNLTRQSTITKLFIDNLVSKPPNYFLKESLLNWAIGGSGNEFIEPDKELRENYLEFEKILKKILPLSLGFKSLVIRNFEIVLLTDTGEFMLDAVSGGVSAIIDLGWQIHINSEQGSDRITVLIDEVENHLHATMQRSILPSLIDAFPNVQFIVSTHSPLIVGSVKDSNVYAFRYNQEKKVYNEKLDLINKAKNANDILNEILGVPFSMPIWVENSLNTIIEKYTNAEITPTLFKDMRQELQLIGLENLMPLAIEKTIEKKDDKNQ